MLQVGKLDLLPPGTMSEYRARGHVFTVCNVAGEIFAIDGVCPHAGAPLAQGALHEHTVVCPWHGYEFDCRTGSGNRLPLRTYGVELHEGIIYLNA